MPSLFTPAETGDLAAENEAHLPSLATIERNTPVQTASKGWRDQWATVYTDRPCRFKQGDDGGEDSATQGREVRRVSVSLTFAIDTDVRPEDRLTLDGLVYLVTAVGLTDKRTKKKVRAVQQ